jgi:hypothetical protein
MGDEVMKIEAGKKYLLRGGATAEITGIDSSLRHYPIKGRILDSSQELCWTETGAFFVNSAVGSPYDIVEEIPVSLDATTQKTEVPKPPRYLVFYNESCSQKIRKFRTRAKALRWIGEFVLAHQDDPDNWIDGLVKGQILSMKPDIEVEQDA